MCVLHGHVCVKAVSSRRKTKGVVLEGLTLGAQLSPVGTMRGAPVAVHMKRLAV
jgi:hypothetical protein